MLWPTADFHSRVLSEAYKFGYLTPKQLAVAIEYRHQELKYDVHFAAGGDNAAVVEHVMEQPQLSWQAPIFRAAVRQVSR
jgi:hypothetical protein